MSKLQETFRKNVLLQLGENSQRWLAEESGIQQGSLSSALSEAGNPTIKTIEAVSKALDVPAGHLLGSYGKSYNIPKDILEMLDGQNPAVYQAIRTVLNTIVSERASANEKSHKTSKKN